ncbi:hypothetical protein AAKU55_005360 [Oxalobacteraceae bacterium GrIS 1.11]
MSAQSISVYIDVQQLEAQQANNYSLYLAKQVNGVFNVIWQSLGPVATVGNPGYEYNNNFQIAIQAYEVNYGTVTTADGLVTFSAKGQPATMNLGETVDLTTGGEFKNVSNGGPTGTLTITNALAANPHEILCDNQGNTIFVNTSSGMDIGPATLTPVDQYQLWFGSLVDTGTIIANNNSNIGTVTFDGTDTQTISYTAAGTWEAGPLPSSRIVFDPEVPTTSTTLIVASTFTTALSVSAVTYLLNKLINKFGSLRPKSITAKVGSKTMTIDFETNQTDSSFALDKYEQAVNKALSTAAQDPRSGIKPNSWTVSEPSMQISF